MICDIISVVVRRMGKIKKGFGSIGKFFVKHKIVFIVISILLVIVLGGFMAYNYLLLPRIELKGSKKITIDFYVVLLILFPIIVLATKTYNNIAITFLMSYLIADTVIYNLNYIFSLILKSVL